MGIKGDDDGKWESSGMTARGNCVFLPNCEDASLNVGGATHFKTGDYLRLSDGVKFTALPGAQDTLLSVAPVADFGFLEANLASILVNESTLSVVDGQTLSFVGGDITNRHDSSI